MAISGACVWEIRSTASAGNIGSGGFVPGGGGVDYSQQDAPQYNATDLTASGGNTATPDVSSASHSFTSDDVGNIINITAGTSWTVGRYQIVSVSGGAARLDRACASVASPSGGTYYVGGAISLGAANDNLVFNSNTVAGGQKIWFKGNLTLANTFPMPGGPLTNSQVVTYEGYNTTRGDAPTGDDRPLLNCATFTASLAARAVLRHMRITGTAADLLTVAISSEVNKCKVVNTSTTANRNAISLRGNQAIVRGSEVASYRGNAVEIDENGGMIIGCLIQASNVGILIDSFGVALNNIIVGCREAGFGTAGSTYYLNIISNTIIGEGQGSGIEVDNGNAYYISGNIIYNWSTGLELAADYNGMGNLYLYNNLYGNTLNYDTTRIASLTGETNLNPDFTDLSFLTGTTATTSGSDLIDASQDFSNVIPGRDYCVIKSGTGVTVGYYGITAVAADRITLDIAPGTNATANKVYSVALARDLGVGSNMKAISYPSAFPFNVATSYLDSGAVQRSEPVGETVYEDPGVENVRSGTVYIFEDVEKTGTLDLPAESDVKSGVQYDGATKTGTYAGSDLWSDPGEANVKIGVEYKVESASNNRTGTYDGSDRWTDPGEANVRDGQAYKANSLTDNKTGTLDLPDVADVELDVTFDGGTKTGELVVLADPQTLADAVWDRLTSEHTTPGSFGALVQKLLTVGKFLGLK